MAKLSLNSNLKSSNNEPPIILRRSFLPSSSLSSSSSTIWIIFLLLSTLFLIIFGYYFTHYLDVWIIQTKKTSSPSPSEILNLPSRTFVPLELSSIGGEQLLINDYNRHQKNHNYLDDDQRLEAEAKIDEAKDYYDDDDDNDNYEDTYLENDGSSTILYNGTIYDSIYGDEDLDHQHQNVSNNNNNNKNSLEKQQKKHYYHHKHKRFKRGVLGLASMIRCITNCNPLSYKNYGCFCGFQGEGRPVDPIDRCCYMHDLCYTRTDCNQVLVYFTSYKWMCHRDGRASCGYVVNGSSQDQCGYQLCECDRRFAKCLRRYRCPKGKPSCRTKRNTILDIAKLLAI